MTNKSIAALATIPLFGALAALSYINSSHIERKSIVVESKERLMRVSTDSDGKTTTTYTNFVYGRDETYVVRDDMWHGHFSAGTVYAKLHEKSTCDVTLAGYRVGFLSSYQNIIEARCE